jgi:hypothetical protein
VDEQKWNSWDDLHRFGARKKVETDSSGDELAAHSCHWSDCFDSPVSDTQKGSDENHDQKINQSSLRRSARFRQEKEKDYRLNSARIQHTTTVYASRLKCWFSRDFPCAASCVSFYFRALLETVSRSTAAQIVPIFGAVCK